MGRNGVGKSTTLKALMGLLSADSGHITLGETIARSICPRRIVPAWVSATCRKVVRSFPTSPSRRTSSSASTPAAGSATPKQTDRIYTLFPIIKEFLHRKGGMLSGGQQQQLAIGRALLTNPKLLILDEPTEGIQPNIIDQIGDAIKMLRDEGEMAILLVEQYLDFCKELGDDFAILERGSVAASDEMANLTDDIVKEFLTV